MPLLLTAFLLAACRAGGGAADTHPDLDRDANPHPDALIGTHSDADIPDGRQGTLARSGGHREDADSYDWHRPDPRAQPDPDYFQPGVDLDAGVRTPTDNGSAPCSEYGGELAAGGRCRLTATLAPTGQQQERCPDVFRCTEELSYWQDEKRSRKEQLSALRDTVSELQQELKDHRERIKTLEMQRSRWLASRQVEADTLLGVHGSLLHGLQTQLHNLSARSHPGCQGARSPGVHMDCASLFSSGVRRSGVYSVVLPLGSMEVYCDMETEGGGWTVFQRRVDGSLSFNRSWQDYSRGFGEPGSEHWLGNRFLHQLSTRGEHSLRIHLEDWAHRRRHALYQSFSVEGEQTQYRLHVSGFSGTAGDSFSWYHDKQGFSTPDTGNICAQISHGGWWYHQCFYANLNGVYYKGGRYSSKDRNLLGPDGVVWHTWKDSDYYSLKSVSMMIRPRGFRPRPSP